MRTAVVKEYRDFGSVKYHSREMEGIFRKHDGSPIVEVIHFGEYGLMNRIFTTERTLKECGISYRYIGKE